MSGYMRIACAVPEVVVGDVVSNTEQICAYMTQANTHNCDLLVFPELAITGYTCQDLFFQQLLIDAVKNGLGKVLLHSQTCPFLCVAVGVPVILDGQLYNCAAVISGGKLRGLIPKTYIPDHDEFNEKRWFADGARLYTAEVDATTLGAEKCYSVPVGTDILFSVAETTVGVEICEDLWATIPPSSFMKLNGAEVIINLAASNEGIGKRSQRETLIKQQSSLCAYAFCSAGCTESTQDLIFSGHSMIAADGKVLAQSKNGPATNYLLMQDADLDAIRADRCSNTSYRQAVQMHADTFRTVACEIPALRSDGSLLSVSKQPFLSEDPIQRERQCLEIFEMQSVALARRLQVTGSNAVIGVSGGLDSTLALLVAVEAMRRLSRPAKDIFAVTMPCFGTTDRTYRNAKALMQLLGVSSKEVNIRKAVLQHFKDIEQNEDCHDATYENAQARERTQVLMDYAGVRNAIVIGTGDLSELALGWCTYNGDHMSMYSVNCSVPKTMIPHIIRAVAQQPAYVAAQPVLEDILDTPISPELLPPDVTGQIAQQTEDIVGPYALHDFFLYYLLRYGFAPQKIYSMACSAFAKEYAPELIKKWLKVFYRRFFTQQFKRDCVPDGVKVGVVSLSPRGDWCMPSDASCALWLKAIDEL